MHNTSISCCDSLCYLASLCFFLCWIGSITSNVLKPDKLLGIQLKSSIYHTRCFFFVACNSIPSLYQNGNTIHERVVNNQLCVGLVEPPMSGTDVVTRRMISSLYASYYKWLTQINLNPVPTTFMFVGQVSVLIYFFANAPVYHTSNKSQVQES